MAILIFIIQLYFGLHYLTVGLKRPTCTCTPLIHALVEYLNARNLLCVLITKYKLIHISGRPPPSGLIVSIIHGSFLKKYINNLNPISDEKVYFIF